MHSNTKKKLNESVANLTSVESFRALIKAMNQENDEMVQTLQEKTPESNKEEVNRLLMLYLDKMSIYRQYLLMMALVAVRFYNNLTFKLFDLGTIEEGDPEFELDVKYIEELSKKMEVLDTLANGALDLEIFTETMFMEVLFNQWFKVAIVLTTGYAIKTPIKDFEAVKSRLEQIRKDRYDIR